MWVDIFPREDWLVWYKIGNKMKFSSLGEYVETEIVSWAKCIGHDQSRNTRYESVSRLMFEFTLLKFPVTLMTLNFFHAFYFSTKIIFFFLFNISNFVWRWIIEFNFNRQLNYIQLFSKTNFYYFSFWFLVISIFCNFYRFLIFSIFNFTFC